MDGQTTAESDDLTFTIELVWDAGRDATAVVWRPPWKGTRIHVGPKGGWLPGHFAALAAAGGFMTTLLRLAEAAHVTVLGYVSVSKLHAPSDRRSPPTISLTPSIVVTSREDASKIDGLCRQAAEVCDVCRALQGRLEVVPDTQIIVPGGEESTT